MDQIRTKIIEFIDKSEIEMRELEEQDTTRLKCEKFSKSVNRQISEQA